MRKHHSAAHARARAARTCLGIITGSLVVIGLTACGGGGDPAPETENPQAQRLTEQAQAAAVASSGTPASNLIMGNGWAAQAPAMPVLASETPSYTPSFTRAFYISTSGNDTAPGTSPETAWKTLSRATSKTDYQAGDAILLKCGDVWREREMALSGDASTGNPSIKNSVLLAAYGCEDGTKKRPVISGASALPVAPEKTWAVLSNTPAVRTIELTDSIKRLFLEGAPQMPARYPNEQGDNRFATANPLPAPDNESDDQKKIRTHRFFKVSEADRIILAQHTLAGATAYVRTNPYTIETVVIKSFDGQSGVVAIEGELAFPVMRGTGYFLEGKTWMVDQPGEWAQDSNNTLHYAATAPVTEKLTAMLRRLTAGGSPKKTYGLWFHQVNNMRIEHLRFEYTDAAIDLSQSSNVIVRDVESLYAHEDGLLASNSNGIQVLDSRFDASGRGSIRIMASSNAQVAGNVVSRNGLFFSGQPLGAGVIQAGQTQPTISFTGWAIRVDGTNSVVENNLVQDTAYVGIAFSNLTGTKVRNNTVLRPCLMLTDCGGIYTHSNLHEMAATNQPISQVHGNLIAGLRSNLDGAFRYGQLDLIAGENQANGIYLDANSTNIEVFNNFVSGAEVGIYLHNSSYNIIRNNETQGITFASVHVNSDADNVWATRGNQILNNKLFSRRTVDLAAFNNTPYKGVRGELTYAQLWQHDKLDASTFFTDKTAGVLDRNVSSGNLTVSLAKDRVPSEWRAESPNRKGTAPMVLEQVTGAAWGLRSLNGSFTQLGRPEWLALTGASASVADSETSPVSFKTHAHTLPALQLTNTWATGWSANAGVKTAQSNSASCLNLATTCAYFYATGTDDRLTSTSFQLTSGVTYRATYVVAAPSSSSARHSSTLRTANAPSAAMDVVSPLTELKPGEVRRITTYMRPEAGFSGVLALRASDGTSAWFNKQVHFSNLLMTSISPVTVLPPLSSIFVSAVNASNEARSFTCADLGITATNCGAVKQFDGQAVTFPVTVAGRSSARFYVAMSDWTDQ